MKLKELLFKDINPDTIKQMQETGQKNIESSKTRKTLFYIFLVIGIILTSLFSIEQRKINYIPSDRLTFLNTDELIVMTFVGFICIIVAFIILFFKKRK